MMMFSFRKMFFSRVRTACQESPSSPHPIFGIAKKKVQRENVKLKSLFGKSILT